MKFLVALKSSQHQVSTTTEPNEVLLSKIESISVSTVRPIQSTVRPIQSNVRPIQSTVRPSHEHKRTQKLLNSFASININTNPNGKSVPNSKDKPKLKSAFRPASDYDYYDDGDSVIGKSTTKV